MPQPQSLETIATSLPIHPDILSKHPKIVHPRMMWILSYMQTKNVHLVCRKFGISRKTFYKWLKRYRNSGGDPTSLLDHPRRPHRCPRATPESVVRRILEAKKETGFGQRRLKNYLAEKYNISVSEHTIWKLVKRFRPENGSGVYAPSPPAGAQAGDLVQISAKDITMYLNQEPYIQSCVEYTVFDTVTMVRISKIYPKHSWRNSSDFVKFVLEKFPFHIREVQTPNDGLFTYSHLRKTNTSFEDEPVPILLKKANIKQTALANAKLCRLPADGIHTFDDDNPTPPFKNDERANQPRFKRQAHELPQGRHSSQPRFLIERG